VQGGGVGAAGSVPRDDIAPREDHVVVSEPEIVLAGFAIRVLQVRHRHLDVDVLHLGNLPVSMLTLVTFVEEASPSEG
jgi:hypothetical protein